MEREVRQINVVSIQTQEVITKRSSAATWGALKEEFPEIELASRGANAWLKEGKADLTSNSADLPAGDIVIYLYVDKMKAGSDVEEFLATLDETDRREAEEIIVAITEVADEVITRYAYF